jgi:hypothetical protein
LFFEPDRFEGEDQFARTTQGPIAYYQILRRISVANFEKRCIVYAILLKESLDGGESLQIKVSGQTPNFITLPVANSHGSR